FMPWVRLACGARAIRDSVNAYVGTCPLDSEAGRTRGAAVHPHVGSHPLDSIAAAAGNRAEHAGGRPGTGVHLPIHTEARRTRRRALHTRGDRGAGHRAYDAVAIPASSHT